MGKCSTTYVENVLVVSEGDDELDYQFSASSGHSATSHPVGMLPANAVVLFVKANDMLRFLCRSVCAHKHTIKVLQAVS